jgi:serine protease Do
VFKSEGDVLFRTFAAAALLVTTTALSATSASAADDPKPADPAETVTPAQRLSAFVEPSIVYVQTAWTARIGDDSNLNRWVKNEPFTVTSNCTGFAVTSDGYIGSAAHCVVPKDDAAGINMRESVMQAGIDYAMENQIYGTGISRTLMTTWANRYWNLYGTQKEERIRMPQRTVKVSWGASVSGIKSEDSRPARVIANQSFNNGDTSLLKVNTTNLNAMPLYSGENLETGTEIASIGYPASVDRVADPDYTPSIKTGQVSAMKTRGGGLTDVYEVDAAVSPGMSGGPTVTMDGEVAGVNSFSPVGESQAFNFVQPVSHLEELIKSEGVDTKLSETTKQYRAGLNAFFEGEKATAVKNLTAVVEDQPANGFASEYLKKAKDLPNPPPPDKGMSTTTLLLIVGGALLLLALLGGLAFMLLRRRSGPGPVPQAPVYAPTPGGEAGGTYPQPQPQTPSQTQPVAKVPTPRTPDEAGVPSGPAPAEPTEVRSSTPAGFAPTSNGDRAGSRPSMSATSQPGVSTSTGPAITSVSQPNTAGEHHFCTQCGAQVAAGGRFCGECGHPV